MSTSKEYFCPNLMCKKANKAFRTRNALSRHIKSSVECKQCQEQIDEESPAVFEDSISKYLGIPHGIRPMAFHQQYQYHAKTNELKHQLDQKIAIDYYSNKRPALLRRHVVNTNVLQEYSFDVHENVNHQDTDCFLSNENDDVIDENCNIMETEINEINNQPSENKSNNSIEIRPSATNASNMIVSLDTKWVVSLLLLLDGINAPDHAYKAIMRWAQEAYDDGYDFRPPEGGLSRSKVIDSMTKNVLKNGKLLLPNVVEVTLPHGGRTVKLPNEDTIHEAATSNVVCFDFVPQLLFLLQNTSIMTAENLAIDIDDPLKKYQCQNNPLDSNQSGEFALDEALSGSVYQEAYDMYITDPTSQLFVPIIQWIDRTNITGNDRFTLKPYMFTPAIFTEKFRRTIKAWGYHGFLPKAKVGDNNRRKDMGDNVRNYHAELREVLASFRNSSKYLKGVMLPIGPERMMKVDIVTCILFIIQDMQEGDMLCGRYGSHTSMVNRQLRACDIGWEQLDNPNCKCNYVIASDMCDIAGSDKEMRKKWSQHKLENAFNDVAFADPVRGIFGATPIETLHCIRKGVIEYVTSFVIADDIKERELNLFNALASAFHKSHRQTYRKSFPTTDFSKGIVASKLSATERVGLIFLFVILFQYDEGWKMMQKRLGHTDKKSVPQLLEVLEGLLTFDAWVNQTVFWDSKKPDDKDARLMSIKKLMKMCKDRIKPLKKENPFRFPKFHEMLHLLDDMNRFGSPRNFCAQRPESLLIQAAKQPGRRAQKRHEALNYRQHSVFVKHISLKNCIVGFSMNQGLGFLNHLIRTLIRMIRLNQTSSRMGVAKQHLVESIDKSLTGVEGYMWNGPPKPI